MAEFNKEEIDYEDQLRQSERERKDLKNIIYELPVGLIAVKGGNELTIDIANHEFCRMSGYELADFSMEKMSMAQLIHMEDYMMFEDAAEVCRRGKTSDEFEARIVTADQNVIWAMFQFQIYTYRSAVPYYLVSCWDITERKKMENEIMLVNERYHMLEEVSDDIVLDYDVKKQQFEIPECYLKFAEDKSVKYAGIEELYGAIHPDDRERFQKIFETALQREMKGTAEYRLRQGGKESGKYAYFRTCYQSIADYDGKISHIIGRSYDISTERAVREKLLREVQLDPLTRIYNKTASGEIVDAFLEKSTQGTHVLYVIDIDDFKKINDTFGHTVGDMVISDIATLIREQFTDEAVVGRVGGDEFMVFVKDTSLQEAEAKAEQLCTNVQKTLSGDGAVIVVTLSVGMAVTGKDGYDYSTLFERADHAMYHIKKNGKNHYGFAGETEEGDCEGKYRTEEKENRRNLVADKEFLNTAFSLLSHARDINGSLNVLLEQIGRKYQMNMVSVFEYAPDGKNMLLTNCWSDMGQIYEKNILPITWPKLMKAEVGEFVQTTPKWQEKRKKEWLEWSGNAIPIQSIAAVKFEYSNGKTGCIDVGSVEQGKQWRTEEIGTICELSRVVAVFVTLREKMQEDQQAIHKLKNRDRLTGLYNLEAFRTKLVQLLKAEENPQENTYALTMVDVNNFSYVNENFGAEMGDSILKEFSQLLERKKVMTACRMYSDYFLVLSKGKSQQEIRRRVKEGNEEFEAKLQERYPAGGMKLSAGICFLSGKSSFETILESANLARKYAKEHNITSGVVYIEKMRQTRDEQVLIATRFHAAIQRGEFEMFLQPKFRLKENTIYGAEALARWHFGEDGYLQPNRFVPALELMGYIKDLDFFILEQLLKYMTKWKESGKSLFTISTNFSRKHFENGGEAFLQRMHETMDKYDIDPSYIEVEVTESVMTEKLEDLKHCMIELAQMGFRIAIDDFGTGYSSLSVLYEIPANVVKIDKSFTDKVMVDNKGEFVSQMGKFIRAAKEEIVVEGIETEEQRQFLESHGFEYGQGYLFDRPIPADEFERKYL